MRIAALVLIASLSCAVTSAEVRPEQHGERRSFAGRPLADVLRELQARGLKIVFSSELVRAGMRVQSEPAAADDRAILGELLEQHGLGVQPGPRGMLVVVRAAPKRAAAEPPRQGYATVHGVVVDARTAAPLSGVLVRLGEADGGVVSDMSGRFEFPGVPPGDTTLVVSLVGYTLARPEITVPPTGVLDLTVVLADGTGTYTEEIAVTGDRFRGEAIGVPAAMTLNSADLLELRGVLSDDPLRAVQTLPAVMTGNDYRSEFSVRGSDFRHVGLTIDGMGTAWPVHTVRDDPSGGSVALINGDVVDTMTLLTGASPQDRPARSGGWLNTSIREGTRAKTQAHAAVSMTSASLVLEGPLGATPRGSWLVSARQSYLQWLLKRINPDDGTTFGFTDMQGKLVFDLTSRQQLQATLVSGRSRLDQYRNEPDVGLVARGSSHATLFVFGWRSMLGSSTVATQRLAASGYGFSNTAGSGTSLAGGSGGEISYRGEVAFALRSATALRLGAHLERQSANQETVRFVGVLGDPEPAFRVETIDGSQSLASVHARMSHSSQGGFAVDGGVLLTHASSAAFSPWVTTTLPFGRLALRAGAGIYRQYPDLAQRVGSFGTAAVGAERSRQVDVAVEYAWRPETRAQVTFYDRRERDTLRLEGDDYTLVGGIVVRPSLAPVWANALDGRSRGVEVLLQRCGVAGVSGWISYSFSRTSYHDKYTGEQFYGDYDQRHTFSAYAQHRLSPVTSLSAKLRIGSNFPIPGYLERRTEALFLSSERNSVRLPAYARLDLRANRAFNFDSRRLTLFVEVINVIGRTNYTTDTFRVLPSGQVLSATQRLFPFLPTAGISFDF
jgi:hypothetical protein